MDEIESVTLTDEQLSDMRETIEHFTLLRNEIDATVHTAKVETAGGRVVHLRYAADRDEFVVDL
jgi:hypothetical protein